jgi:hypothetical protein
MPILRAWAAPCYCRLQHVSAALPAYQQPKPCRIADYQAEAEAAGHASGTEAST